MEQVSLILESQKTTDVAAQFNHNLKCPHRVCNKTIVAHLLLWQKKDGSNKDNKTIRSAVHMLAKSKNQTKASQIDYIDS